MKSNLKKSIVFYFMVTFFSLNAIFAQRNNFSKNNVNEQTTVLTWNKNTPEQEMLDDINALREQGISIKFSNVKRNTKGEITALRIEYKDLEGNYGSQEYNGNKPIAPIKFYKNKNGIGFGDANMGMAFTNFNDLQKSLRNQIQMDPLLDENFGFSSDSDSKIKKKSRIIIQESGKKPLIIEDGEVIEGGENYTAEEIDKIKNQHEFELNENDKLDFNFNSDDLDLKTMKEQMQKMQNQLLQMIPNNEKGVKEDSKDLKNLKDLKSNDEEITKEDLKSDDEITNERLKHAREEMLRVKKELEEAKKELQKTKSEIIMRKI
jgi:hypothetical protein